jgi:DNA-binding MarR family transcriptional regulator
MSSTTVPRERLVGGMMRICLQWVLETIDAEMRVAGYDDIGRFHMNLFRHDTPDGLRPTEVADRLGITKQSVNELVRDMEARGYVVLEPDPSDGRARIIQLTARGRRLARDAHEAAAAAERAIAEVLGARRFADFQGSLREVVSHIEAGDLSISEPRGDRR